MASSVLLTALWAFTAAAEEGSVALHGYAKAGGQLGLSEPLFFAATSRLQTDLTGRKGPAGFRATMDLDLDASLLDPGDMAERQAELRVLPVELRTDLHLRHFDLSAGKQYVFWGQTDWVNPTDLFTPWDYVNISNELEDYRIAPWALRATGYLSESSLDLVWVPLPLPHAMDFSSMESEGLEVGDPQLPARGLANGDFGARLTGRFAGFDAALMAFHGMDKRPGFDMEADSSQMPPLLTLLPTYGPLDAIGADISRGLGPLLFKAEAAQYWTADREGDDPAVRNPELAAVAGLTWVPHQAFNISVQGTWNHLQRYDSDADLAVLQAMGDPDPQVDPADAWGLVERVAWSFRDLLSLSVVGVQGLPEGDHFELAYLSWRAADGLTVLAGVLLFGGPPGTRFGELEGYSRGFVEMKYAF